MYRFLSETLPDDGLSSYERDSARVMTAMTFDAHGEPVDYFKQVFAAFEIAEHLAEDGVSADVVLLIADNFVSLNQEKRKQGLDANTIQRCANNRHAVLDALAERYGGDLEITVQFTSKLQDEPYTQIIDRLGDRVESDPIFRKLLLRSVPDHRQDPQLSARENTNYTRGEIATIIRSGTDIKVGPRRERLYDAAARDTTVREIAPGDCPPIIGVYVSDSYPTSIKEERLEQLRQERGVLPYKAKSRGLDPGRHRILLRDGVGTLEKKVQEAPPELQRDLESLAVFMDGQESTVSDSIPERLAQEFDEIRSIADLTAQRPLI